MIGDLIYGLILSLIYGPEKVTGRLFLLHFLSKSNITLHLGSNLGKDTVFLCSSNFTQFKI
jgi:hypothetical protein